MDSSLADDSALYSTRSVINDRLTDRWNMGSDEPRRLRTTQSQITLKDWSSAILRTGSKSSTTPPTPAFDQLSSSRSMSYLSLDVQDHSKLKKAWDAMLTHRFLAPQLVTVLPFYLSSIFVDVRTHDTLHIPLPPNSRSQKQTRNAAEGLMSRHDSLEPEVVFRMKPSSLSTRSPEDPASSSPGRTVSSWARMHLGKTVHTVVACKESIWVEYEKLFDPGPPASPVPPVGRTLNRTARGSQKDVVQPSLREDFEIEWSNWEKWVVPSHVSTPSLILDGL